MLRLGIALLIFQIGFIYLNVPLKLITPVQEVKGTSVEAPVPSTEYKEGRDIATKDLDPRVKAFLNLIAYAEGTAGPRGYYMQYTGVHFTDDSKHPDQVIGAWATVHGKRKWLASTAAGRYQYLSSTWNRVAKKGNLSDFSPTSQDTGAIILLKERGSYSHLLKRETPTRKDIERAIYLSREEWASLPGSPHGQPTKGLNDSVDKYFEYLEYYKTRK